MTEIRPFPEQAVRRNTVLIGREAFGSPFITNLNFRFHSVFYLPWVWKTHENCSCGSEQGSVQHHSLLSNSSHSKMLEEECEEDKSIWYMMLSVTKAWPDPFWFTGFSEYVAASLLSNLQWIALLSSLFDYLSPYNGFYGSECFYILSFLRWFLFRQNINFIFSHRSCLLDLW